MLVKQPNGKICVCSYDGMVEKMNLTEDEYIEYYLALAKKKANKNLNNIQNFGKLVEKQKVKDRQLVEMGSDKTLNELLKFVPRKPLQTKYISVNFETQGICPSCGNIVVDGMGGTDEICKKCGQILIW